MQSRLSESARTPHRDERLRLRVRGAGLGLGPKGGPGLCQHLGQAAPLDRVILREAGMRDEKPASEAAARWAPPVRLEPSAGCHCSSEAAFPLAIDICQLAIRAPCNFPFSLLTLLFVAK